MAGSGRNQLMDVSENSTSWVGVDWNQVGIVILRGDGGCFMSQLGFFDLANRSGGGNGL